jgi:hypothetical protein
MSTRTQTNRNNAQHSTGPKTEAGKQRSSLNALRHGLTSQVVVMPGEDLLAYLRHVESFIDEYAPKGPTEAHLVQALADTSWRLNRVAAIESNILSGAIAQQPLAVDAPAPIQDALALASAFESQSKALATLSLHTQRLSRQFERTVAFLRDLQKARKTQQTQEPVSLPVADGFVFSKPPAPDDNRGIQAIMSSTTPPHTAHQHACLHA